MSRGQLATTLAVSDASEFATTDHERYLREAGSFTATWTFESTDVDGVQSSMESRYLVALDDERSHESFTIAGGEEGTSFEKFYADRMVYSKLGGDESTFYQVTPDETDLVENALTRAVTGYEDKDEATFTGRATFDGETVDRYEYSNPAVWREYGAGMFGTEEAVTVTDFTLVVLVDQDGLVRSTHWTVTGETDDGSLVTATWRYTITDVGSTTVPDPEWLADAKAQGQQTAGN